MIWKNLIRRKTRTLLTILGISIGVAAIIGLGALADGLEMGYNSMMAGSKADLVLSQPNTFDVSYSTVDESVEPDLLALPEVDQVSGMIQGFVQAENEPFFFIFGYPSNSFILSRFQVIRGVSLTSRESQKAHGNPMLLGSAAAEVLNKDVGDSLRLTGSVFRIVGIYQTGDAFEDSGAVMQLDEAQVLLGRPRQVSLYYITLRDPALQERFIEKAARKWPDLSISRTEDFANKQSMQDSLRAIMWAIGGLAIVIGGVGMMNAQLMSVFERTREIGVLRAIGWSHRRVLRMILGEAILVCLAGGILGTLLGWLALIVFSQKTTLLRMTGLALSPDLFLQAFIVVIFLGLVGGLYPAYRASRLQPVEALRYEGGGGGKVHRFPIGGLALQSLWQRSTRTLLTLGTIGLTVGAILALQGFIDGFVASFSGSFTGQVEIMIRQADINDTSLSAVDERIAEKIAALPQVLDVSPIIFTAVVLPESNSFFILQGYSAHSQIIQRFKIVQGKPLSGSRQIILGSMMAESMKKSVGDVIELGGSRFRVVGIFETGVSWEETGGVIGLRDAQQFVGRPRKANMLAVKLREPDRAQTLVEKFNREYSDVHASLSGEFVEQMPDMKNSDSMMNGISILSIVVGGVGVLNTMLMAVFERTREIGVLRALGWRRRAVLGMILQEAIILGLMGGAAGIGIAFGLTALLQVVPVVGSWVTPVWSWQILARALGIALLLGVIGGLYPAYRATRLQPIEALRYE